MIHTAEALIKAKYKFYDPNVIFKDVELNGEQVEALIKEAQIEAIKECAEVARSTPFTFSKEQQQQKCPAKVITKVDKQSILKILDQIK